MLTLNEFTEIGDSIPSGAFSEYDMMALYPALKELTPDSVYVEIGVDRGRSLGYARTVSKANVYGIDVRNQLDADWFKDKKKWKFIHGDANEVVKSWTLPIDVLFIDGNHDYEAVKADYEKWLPHVRPGKVIYFHDVDKTSPGVVKFFSELKVENGLSRDSLDDRNTSVGWIKT